MRSETIDVDIVMEGICVPAGDAVADGDGNGGVVVT